MNLNPFDLRGPPFLLFYLCLAALTTLVVWLLRRARESGEPGQEIAAAREIAEDPYKVAFLRGGRYEAVHVALVSLIERGLLQVKGEYLFTATSDAADKARRPLDKAILTRFASRTQAYTGRKAELVYANPAIMAEADHIGEELQRRHLLPDDTVKQSRRTRLLLAVAFLWVIALIKVGVAIYRGHTNIGFLILLAILMPFVLLAVSRRFRTVLGDKTCHWIQSFFTNLRGRREAFELNSTNSELTFLAAAFGLTALPMAVGGLIAPLHLKSPKPAEQGWGSCGSSCASFSSCGGGGGCGGGGCGGSCGGCGG